MRTGTSPPIPPLVDHSTVPHRDHGRGDASLLVHDRDAIYAPAVDRAVASMGLRVLKTPVRTPQANAFCERLIGTIRRECLDWLIPLNERHLRRILREWVTHYNRGRPHASLGPGIPEASPARDWLTAARLSSPRATSSSRDAYSQWAASRVSLGDRGRVMAASILRSTTPPCVAPWRVSSKNS